MTTKDDVQTRARLPSVDAMLRLPQTQTLIDQHGRASVLAGIRETIDDERRRSDDGSSPEQILARLNARLATWLEDRETPSLRPVFNLTGTVLHTNLGRALLPREA